MEDEQNGSGQALALVRNYRNGGGRWETLIVPFGETAGISEAVRSHNFRVMEESLFDARDALCGKLGRRRISTDAIIGVATFLAQKRTVHIDKVVDEWLQLRIHQARTNGHTNNGGAYE
jgi:hypothetical protein